MDMWSCKAGDDFFGVIAHFINEDWENESILIGFESPKSAHTGEHMADLFEEIISDFEITDKIFTITCDNAHNNLAMGRILEERLQTRTRAQPNSQNFSKKAHIIPCLNHVLDLALKDFLKSGLKSRPYNDAQNVHSLISSTDFQNQENNEEVFQNPINKLRQGIIKIRYTLILFFISSTVNKVNIMFIFLKSLYTIQTILP